MKTETYFCSACGGEFEKMQSDADAIQESEFYFGPTPREQLTVVCDDCFRWLMANLGVPIA